MPRVAHAFYRLGRELERSLAVARLLEVSNATSLEGPLANGAGRRDVWEAVVAIAGDPAAFRARHVRAEGRSVAWYLSLSDWNPDGVVACLARVRERAGEVRSLLPAEVFEAVSAVEIAAREWSPSRVARDGLFAFCDEVRWGVAGIDGVVDRCMRRDEHWELLRLGRYVERAMQVTRLLGVYATVRSGDDDAAGLGDWRVVLRVASAYEAYLRVALPERDRPSAAAFLLLDPALPGSVAFALGEIFDALDALGRVSGSAVDAEAKAAVFAASRAAALAAQPSSLQRGAAQLAVRLDKMHDAFASILFPPTEVADGIHAQAARQAQN
jgi:uncharacterized alpha-E superfamily protein